MKVQVIREAGDKEALLGLSLSKGCAMNRVAEVAVRLSSMDGGHNKILESIYLWLDVTAPRYWWQEADTYRLSTKQSDSTMHTIHKRRLSQEDFEFPIYEHTLMRLNDLIEDYKAAREAKMDITETLVRLKNELPEGFIQRRVWVMNYKCLRNIIMQRRDHRLPHWHVFCTQVLNQVEHPELLPSISDRQRLDTFPESPVF